MYSGTIFDIFGTSFSILILCYSLILCRLFIKITNPFFAYIIYGVLAISLVILFFGLATENEFLVPLFGKLIFFMHILIIFPTLIRAIYFKNKSLRIIVQNNFQKR